MKISTTSFLKDLDGSDLKDLSVGKTLAGIVGSQTKAVDPMKNFILAQKFYTQDEVEIDVSDLNLVKECVKTSDRFTSIVTGQLLIILNEKTETK
jgi:hypothetical protein